MRANKAINGEINTLEFCLFLVILGAVFSIALVLFNTFLARTQVSTGIISLKPIQLEVMEYYLDAGKMPKDARQLGLEQDKSKPFSRYIQKVTVENGKITATFSTGGHELIQGKSITLFPYRDEMQGLVWVCQKSSVDEDYKPFPSTNYELINIEYIPDEYLPNNCRK
ncbi:MAG: pilin [Gammaproteobacteria bacterium]